MQIQFDTVVQQGRVEEGEPHDDGDVTRIETNHENRPDFILHDSGRVDLVAANVDRVIDEFGENGRVLD